MSGRTDFLPRNNSYTNYYEDPGGRGNERNSRTEHNYLLENPAFFLFQRRGGDQVSLQGKLFSPEKIEMVVHLR
jgi:hypothetical protein